MDITGLDGAASELLAQQVAAFLVALHGIAIETATAAGVPGDWSRSYGRLFEASLPPLCTILRPSELSKIEAWRQAFFDTPANWEFQPTLVHGDVRPEHLLTDSGGLLTGVIDFGDACIGDPAIDIGGLLAYVDAPFAEQVQAAYERLRGVSDGDMMRRASLLAASTPLFTVAAAAAGPRPAVPSLDEAIAELRAGAILQG
jgi:aminoglycoside 2''-phosphotransferase